MENLKNSLYRQLSSARQSGLFWPKFYYSWFYADEKTLYNMLNLRQKLGLKITEKEINSYNKMREQIAPVTNLKLKSTTVRRSVDGTGIAYTDVKIERNNLRLYLLSLLIGTIAHRTLKLSRWWILGAFVPVLLLNHLDKKFVPYGELENFYKYVYERRKAEAIFKNDENKVEKELSRLNKDDYEKLKNVLIKSNRTLYEVSQDLDEMYLRAAIHNED
jgi:hypothetical protein